jgi:hypothetical protein
MEVLAQVMNSFENRNFMQSMGRLSMHSKCLDCFLLSFGWGDSILGSLQSFDFFM